MRNEGYTFKTTKVQKVFEQGNILDSLF